MTAPEQHVAEAVEAALYMSGEYDPCTEEDARAERSRFRVELDANDGHTYHLLVYRADDPTSPVNLPVS